MCTHCQGTRTSFHVSRVPQNAPCPVCRPIAYKAACQTAQAAHRRYWNAQHAGKS